MSQPRITPSLVISILALIIALGGASYAAIKIPAKSVGTKQLKRNAVSTPKLKRNAVTTAKIKPGSIAAARLRESAVNSAKVRDGSLEVQDFAAGVIPGQTWYSSRDDSAFLVLDTGPLADVVSTPELPAGNYVAIARANILGGAAASTVLCSMTTDAAQNFTVAASATFPLAMSGVARLPEPSSLTLQCNKSAGTPQIAQAHLTAIRVGDLTRTPPLE